jgi:hypothetical protein
MHFINPQGICLDESSHVYPVCCLSTDFIFPLCYFSNGAVGFHQRSRGSVFVIAWYHDYRRWKVYVPAANKALGFLIGLPIYDGLPFGVGGMVDPCEHALYDQGLYFDLMASLDEFEANEADLPDTFDRLDAVESVFK